MRTTTLRAAWLALGLSTGLALLFPERIVAQPPADPTVGVAPSFSYYQVRADVRRCVAPVCGGFFVRRVDLRSTQCSDGASRPECYVAEIDFAARKLGDDPGPELRQHAGTFLLRGALDPVSFPGMRGELDVLRVSEVLVTQGGASPRDTFFRVRSTGIVCVRSPCPSLASERLNSSEEPQVFELIDLSAATEDPTQALERTTDPAGLIVAGQRTTRPGFDPAGSTPRVGAIVASAAYLPFSTRTQTRACGSRGLAQCAGGEFCSFPPQASCGRSDAPGVCTSIPELCTKIFSPVCGCDGATYPNACEANAVGVSVEFPGACTQSSAK